MEEQQAKKPIVSKETKKYILIFIITILLHWLIMVCSYLILTKDSPDKDFLGFIYEKYNDCGDTEHYIYLAKNGYSSGR